MACERQHDRTAEQDDELAPSHDLSRGARQHFMAAKLTQFIATQRGWAKSRHVHCKSSQACFGLTFKRFLDQQPRSPPNVSVTRIEHLRFDVTQQIAWCFPTCQPTLVSNISDGRSDVRRDLADTRQCRIETALLDVFVADELG